MKKDMTTFEMAQAAYESPGKVFVDQNGYEATWHNNRIIGLESRNEVHLHFLQTAGYIWNEKVEPRKWSGEYERNERGSIAGDDCGAPFAVIPHGVKARVKWEAEEVL